MRSNELCLLVRNIDQDDGSYIVDPVKEGWGEMVERDPEGLAAYREMLAAAARGEYYDSDVDDEHDAREEEADRLALTASHSAAMDTDYSPSALDTAGAADGDMDMSALQRELGTGGVWLLGQSEEPLPGKRAQGA